jgi:hypothetical protein
MAKFRRYNARDERQDFSTRIIDPQEPRSAVESSSLQMTQEILRERSAPIDRTTDCVSDSDNTPRHSSSVKGISRSILRAPAVSDDQRAEGGARGPVPSGAAAR